jgi:hypothetical protein
MATDHGRRQVRALIDQQAVRVGDKPHVAGRLQRLCRAASTALPASGVGVSVMAENGPLGIAASSEASQVIEELQFTMGEGPCIDAYSSGSPVLMPDLSSAAGGRWPGYAPALQDHGVRAVFAFPLQVGAARLGALDVYQHQAGPLPTQAVRVALNFADEAIESLLHATIDPETIEGVETEQGLMGHLELHQAQGMVMVQLGVSLAEAIARLRAHAYAHDRRLSDLACDIVARRVVLEADSEGTSDG